MDLEWEDFLPLFIPHTIKVGRNDQIWDVAKCYTVHIAMRPGRNRFYLFLRFGIHFLPCVQGKGSFCLLSIEYLQSNRFLECSVLFQRLSC